MRPPSLIFGSLLTRLIMAALAAVIFVSAGTRQVNAGSNELDAAPPQIISFEYDIDFGRGIDVDVEAAISSPVDEVRAVFRAVGPRQVSSYAYPSYSQADTLTASFTIDTGTFAYYPPGTEFEVFLEATLPDGSRLSTDRSRFLYLDPSRDWKALSRPEIPLDIHYYGFSDGTAATIADRVESSWRDIAAALGIDVETVERRRAVIYPSLRDASESFPPTSAAATDGSFFGGFALDRYNVFVIGYPSADTAVHELTHLLVGQVVSSLLSPGTPSWLNEGLAQYFEKGSASYYSQQLGTAARSGDLLTLRTRNTVPSTSNEIGLFYAEVGSFVGELIEIEGPERMAETLRLINDGSTAAEAMESAYGRPLWQLENEWRVRLGATALPAPVETGSTPTVDATVTPQATATVKATPVGDSGVGLEPQDDGGGFNMTGPLIGAIAAAVVFAIWSFFVNRKRFRRYRR